jgi:hypothetical protein
MGGRCPDATGHQEERSLARKIRVKARKARKEKYTRFPISRQAEILLASTGVVLLLVTSILLMAYYAPKIWGGKSAVTATEKPSVAAHAKLWDRLKQEGVVLNEVKERESVLVDATRWKALPFYEQQAASAAAADRFQSDRCFVLDASDTSTLGYFSRRNGYQASKGTEKSRP